MILYLVMMWWDGMLEFQKGSRSGDFVSLKLKSTIGSANRFCMKGESIFIYGAMKKEKIFVDRCFTGRHEAMNGNKQKISGYPLRGGRTAIAFLKTIT